MTMQHPEHESSDLDRWIDGTLERERAQAFQQRAAASPELAAELARADAIEAALARRFEPPAGLGVPDVARRAAPRNQWRFVPLALAAGLLLAAGAWLLWNREAPPPAVPVVHGPGVPVHPAGCKLDEVYANAAATDFEPRGAVRDAEILASLSPCDQLTLVGEWKEPTLDSAKIVMLRSGLDAEPILLFVPHTEAAADMCRAAESDLSLYTGCLKGRQVFELSRSGQSRVLPCMEADRLERL